MSEWTGTFYVSWKLLADNPNALGYMEDVASQAFRRLNADLTAARGIYGPEED